MATQSPPPPFRARDIVALTGAEEARVACISIWIRERYFDFYGGDIFGPGLFHPQHDPVFICTLSWN